VRKSDIRQVAKLSQPVPRYNSTSQHGDSGRGATSYTNSFKKLKMGDWSLVVLCVNGRHGDLTSLILSSVNLMVKKGS